MARGKHHTHGALFDPMESQIPSSLIGAAVFFGLATMIAWLLIRETLRIVLKPLLLVVLLALAAVWAGLLEGTVLEEILAWTGERLVVGLAAVAEWVGGAYERTVGGGGQLSG